MPEDTQELEAEPGLDPGSKFVWIHTACEKDVQEIIQGPGSSSSTSREERGVRVGAGRNQLTWLWAGHCGHPAGGQGHSARPHCSHSRRAPGSRRAGGGQLDRECTAWIPALAVDQSSPPHYTSFTLRHTRQGLQLFCPFHRHHAVISHAFA